MTGTPIEVWENLTGMTVARKELLPDSGGAGRIPRRPRPAHRAASTTAAAMSPSRASPAAQSSRRRGVLGGKAGRVCARFASTAKIVHPKGRYVLKPGDRMTTIEAGGGGYGDPRRRARAAVLADYRAGFVSREAALRDHGVDVGSA